LTPEPIINNTKLLFLNPVGPELMLIIIALIGLLIASALISGSEVAFFALKPDDLIKIRSKKTKRAKLIKNFLSNPKKLLATILIANNFANVGVIILATYVSDSLFKFEGNEWAQFLIQIVIITFLLLLFGEVLPKVYANNKPISFAKFMSIPLSFLDNIFKPISSILISSTNIIDRKTNKNQHNLSVDDLSNALELTSSDHEDKSEKKILEEIVRFGNTDVKQIMRSRLDITALDDKCTFTEVLKTIKKTGFSRIPIYSKNFDNIKGVLYIKDLLPFLNQQANFKWNKLIREVFFVPENKKIDDLLKEFQYKKIHLAIVVDEYGGTSGIVTLEDIIEEIVGDINDEFDDDEITYSKLDSTNYVFEGKTSLNDFYRIININGEEFEKIKGESDSLAGFIIENIGSIPEKGEKFNFNNYTFTIENVNDRRITRIKVTLVKNEKH